jgi:O-antigen/teichoic acid export membrane protein
VRRLKQSLSVGHVARGGVLLFIGVIGGSMLGYVYWLIVSYFGGPGIVGIASSVNSLGTLVGGIAGLGLSTGVQRFLGRDFTHKRTGSLNAYFWSSLVFCVVLCLISAVVIWVIAFLNISLIKNFSETMLILAGLIVFLSFSGIFQALFISTIKTGSYAVSYILASFAKLVLGVLLVYMGFGWFGATMGIVFSSLSMIVLMLFFALRDLRSLGGVKIRFSSRALRESLVASSVSWLPSVVALLGSQLGILTVYGFLGGAQAGTYFIAYTIFTIVYTLPSSFLSLMFPVLSGVTNGGKQVAWRVLKICLAVACPATAFLVLYPGFLLSMVGESYVNAATTLSLLALSIIPMTLILAVTNLVYASGSYGKVLGLGLALNVPQVLLYFALVPIYGEFGAGLSFLSGALIGLVAAAIVSRRVRFQASLKKIGLSTFIPLLAGFLCLTLKFDWFIGGSVILLASVLSYGRLGVVERVDLAEIARGFASEETVARASSRLNWVLRVIYG